MPFGFPLDKRCTLFRLVLGMSLDSTFLYLDAIFIDACDGVFQRDYAATEVTDFYDPPDFTEMAVACVDGGTDDFEVILTLNMPLSALAMTYPVQSITAIDERELEDWVSELANRLLGKFNEKLLKFGHHLTVGLPQHGVGVEFIQVLNNRDRGHFFYHDFEIDGELFRASIQIELFHQDIQFKEVDDLVQANVDDGEIEFF